MKDSSVTRTRRAHRPASSKCHEPRGGGLGLRAAALAATSGPKALAAWGPQRPLRGRSSDPARLPPTPGIIRPLLRVALRPVGTLSLASRPAKKSQRGSSGCPGKCSSLRRQRGAGPRPLCWVGSAVDAPAARRRLVAQSMTDRESPAGQAGEKTGSRNCNSQQRQDWERGGRAERAKSRKDHSSPTPRFAET